MPKEKIITASGRDAKAEEGIKTQKPIFGPNGEVIAMISPMDDVCDEDGNVMAAISSTVSTRYTFTKDPDWRRP